MGIQFQIGSDRHYGWARIQGGRWGDELTLVPPSWVLDWAYEARLGVSIFAGAVPEPSTFALLIGGGVLLVWFRQKRNERTGKVTGANSRPASQFEGRGLRRRTLAVESHGGYHGGAAVAQFCRSVVRRSL